MKYNLRKIMKRAWEIKRKGEVSFAEALKMSWKVAKHEVCLLEEWGREESGTVWYNIWVGYGMIRAYYKCSWFSKYENTQKKNNFVELKSKGE